MADELDRMVRLHVLREEHDSELGVVGAEDAGGTCAVVGVVGWHADVDDCEVGERRIDGGDQARCVDGLRDDLVAGVLEETREPFAEEGAVLADHDAQGRNASSTSLGERNEETMGQRAPLAVAVLAAFALPSLALEAARSPPPVDLGRRCTPRNRAKIPW